MTGTIEFQQTSAELSVVLAGEITKATVPALWAELLAHAKMPHPAQLSIDVSAVSHYDLAGLILIDSIPSFFSAPKPVIQGADQALLDGLKRVEPEVKKAETLEKKKIFASIPSDMGRATLFIVDQVCQNLIYTGAVCHFLWQAIRRPKLLRWRDVFRVMEDTGPNALPIIALLGFIIGLILSFQASVQLQKFGATIFVVNLVGISLVRELSALFTAIILAGRTASSFAAEIGTMKVNQELDALSTMGLSSVRFLVIPRVIAVTLMLPLLSIFMSFFGLLGCAVFMRATEVPWEIFLRQLEGAVTMGDFWGGLFKAVVFGILVAAIGCANGLKTGNGASAVGQSTTRAVVGTIVTLIVVDGLFAVLFYCLSL